MMRLVDRDKAAVMEREGGEGGGRERESVCVYNI
jgi:hypothetical protein